MKAKLIILIVSFAMLTGCSYWDTCPSCHCEACTVPVKAKPRSSCCNPIFNDIIPANNCYCYSDYGYAKWW